jgi:hypothetical protein
MTMQLKGFSQEVDISNPDEVTYFLTFSYRSKDIKLPVQQETAQALIDAIYGDPSPPEMEIPEQPQYVEPEEAYPEEADTFGGDYEEELGAEAQVQMADYGLYESEEDIPSL